MRVFPHQVCACVLSLSLVYGLFWSFVSPIILSHSLLGTRAPTLPPKTELEAVLTPRPTDTVPLLLVVNRIKVLRLFALPPNPANDLAQNSIARGLMQRNDPSHPGSEPTSPSLQNPTPCAGRRPPPARRAQARRRRRAGWIAGAGARLAARRFSCALRAWG